MKELSEILLLVLWVLGVAAGWLHSWWLALLCFFMPPIGWIVLAVERLS
jgi:hypothetical protein